MSVSGRKKQESIKAIIQVGFLISAFLAICILLGVSLFVSRELQGTAGMLFLLIMSIAITLLIIFPLLIILILQRKIDSIFTDVADHYRAYREGNYRTRAPIYGNDSFAILITSINGLLEHQNRRLEEMATEQATARASASTERKRRSTGYLRTIETEPEIRALSVENTQAERQIQQVTRALRTLVDRTTFQEQASRAQAIQVFQTTEKIENLALSLHQLTRNIQGSISLGQAGLARLRRSDETLGQAVEEMGGLQKGTQRAAQQVYTLGEHTQTLRSLISTIEEVVTHILFLGEHMLLLNTPDSQSELESQETQNTQATQGQDLQLVMLVQDILALANRALDATTEITTLTTTIEAESHQAVASLQGNNQAVTQKAQLVKESGQLLQDLYRNMEFQASMLQDLAQTASEQTEVVDETSTSLGQIAKMAYQASKETQQNAQGLKKVAAITEQIALPAPTAEDGTPLLRDPSSLFPPKRQLNA